MKTLMEIGLIIRVMLSTVVVSASVVAGFHDGYEEVAERLIPIIVPAVIWMVLSATLSYRCEKWIISRFFASISTHLGGSLLLYVVAYWLVQNAPVVHRYVGGFLLPMLNI